MNRRIKLIDNSPPLETQEEWDIFEQIMDAVKRDGGSVTSVKSLMGIAKGLAYRIQWEKNVAQEAHHFSTFLLAAQPLSAKEASFIAGRIYGPNAEIGPPDPSMVKAWLPYRIHDEGGSL